MRWAEEFKAQMRAQLGSEADAFFASMQAEYARGIRLNPMKKPLTHPDIGEKIPWADNGFYLEHDSLLGADARHEAGAYYLQEPSAMLPAMVLQVQEGDRVLDLCAAPGGKTTQLGAMLNGTGLLISNEINLSRAKILSSNVERMGLANTVVISADPGELAPRWEGFFDRILVDAPCSGEGMFRRHPEAQDEWTPASPDSCALRQKNILESAASMLKAGGVMVYSTCTFNTKENDEQIESFLSRHPEFEAVPFTVPGIGEAESGMLHIWPHRVRGEGHFVAKMRKTDAKDVKVAPYIPERPDKASIRLLQDFWKETLDESIREASLFMGRLALIPDGLPDLSRIKVLRMGLHLGEAKGTYFVPDHALSHAKNALKTVSVNDEEAKRYLHGETLDISENLTGWCTASVDGYPIGWGKASGGQMKNHYPKGLRK